MSTTELVGNFSLSADASSHSTLFHATCLVWNWKPAGCTGMQAKFIEHYYLVPHNGARFYMMAERVDYNPVTDRGV